MHRISSSAAISRVAAPFARRAIVLAVSAAAFCLVSSTWCGARGRRPSASAGAQESGAAQNAAPLKDAFKSDFLIGSILSIGALEGRAPLETALAGTHFSSLTPENSLKPASVQPVEGQFNFAQGDRLVEIAQKSGAAPIGHCLVWHSQTPRWFFEGPNGQPVTRELALARMRTHISTVVGHYKGKIKQWDVVNEAINDGPGLLRPSPWQKAIGDDYIAEAFKAAHAADPNAILIYNDYNIELPYKRPKAIQLLKSLLDQKAPIDAVGIQCHWRMDGPDFVEVEKAIQEFGALGLKVMITELDLGILPTRYQGADISRVETMTPEQLAVMNPYTKGLPEEQAKRQAERYKQAFEMFLRHKDVIGRVTFWGVMDSGSWLNNFPIRGRTDYPLLFDREGKPKPAFYAVRKTGSNQAASPPAPVIERKPTLTIDAAPKSVRMSARHYGLMTEEINYSYDGGLYAELVRNRAFLDNANTPAHWTPASGHRSSATIAIDKAQPLNSVLTASLRLDVAAATGEDPAGVANEGYWGIPIKPRTRYRASFFAKAAPGFAGPVLLRLESPDGATIYAKAAVPRIGSDWKQYNVSLSTDSAAPSANGRFALRVAHPGTIWFSLVSLFPPTWKNQPNGFRPDLMQMLVDLKPAFLRFPGGNYIEGNTIETRFDWKKTIGPLTERPGHPGPWGYRSTDGLGLLEFLVWCQDMAAEPVLAVYAGYSLRGEHVNPGSDLAPYVQDALDEIEYVTGSVSTHWGARRAKDGHPAPFPLRYVEIGNEDFFDRSGSYEGRFAQFYDAIKAKYPNLRVVSTVGNEQPAEKRVHSRRPDVLDEHYYRTADSFVQMSPAHYDSYDRTGPEIFVGEWAAHEEIAPWDRRSRSLPPTPSMKAAIGDAAWMTGMERNADMVTMQCYAPLLVRVNPGARQWRPDLIGYDSFRSFGSPSYYAQQMFSGNHGDAILKVSSTGVPLLSSVTNDSRSGAIFIKYVNPTASPQEVEISLRGVRSVKPTGLAIQLAANPDDTNSIDEPAKVVPVTMPLSGIKPQFVHRFPAYSITVLRLDAVGARERAR